MIYRPAPVTEVKAAIIDEQIRGRILADRASSVPSNGNLDDPGLVPAEGRITAIKKRIVALEAQRAQLILQNPNGTIKTKAITDTVIDPVAHSS